jgi:hypothetical protein
VKAKALSVARLVLWPAGFLRPNLQLTHSEQMNAQRCLRLSHNSRDGTSSPVPTQRAFTRFDLEFETGHTPASKLLADMIKRHARYIMHDITTCPPDAIAAHLARSRDLDELARLAMRHGFVSGPEGNLSGMQLADPVTVMDFVAALDITRQRHRAPDWICPHDEQFIAIMRRLDVLAAQIAKGGAL